MARTIDYYFSMPSPWAYLGHATFVEMAQRHGAAIAVTARAKDSSDAACEVAIRSSSAASVRSRSAIPISGDRQDWACRRAAARSSDDVAATRVVGATSIPPGYRPDWACTRNRFGLIET